MLSRKPTVIDLFSGAGLFSLAFCESGFRIIQAVEIDPVAATSYAANIGNHITVGDVAAFAPIAKCDVLIAGPPCQGFSTLGARRADDPRNTLSLQVVRWAKLASPKIVVIENVAAFLNSATWSQVARSLRRLGYGVAAFELDAADYQVPQFRRRSFTVATLDGLRFAPPRPRSKRTCVREALHGLPSEPDGRNHHYSPEPSRLALSRMKAIRPGGDKRDVMKRAPHLAPPSWWRLSCQVTDAWGRMEWESPCNTLRTALQNPSKGRYIHPEQHRVISLREAARLHTIPDTFKFEGRPTHVARQIGNSVPPNLGRAIAQRVLKTLTS
jgi:DNA (cytosine-5)-methyltransferase 1